MLSTTSVQSAKRVRLVDVISGSIPRPASAHDSSGDDYVPPVISASRTLESRYSLPFFGCRVSEMGSCVAFRDTCSAFPVLHIVCVAVAGAEPGPGVESSGNSDVFVCEVAVDTPALVSDAISELPGVSSKRGRTQHGRVAVGVEASVVYNDWENCTLNFHVHSALYVIFVLCYFCSWFSFSLQCCEVCSFVASSPGCSSSWFTNDDVRGAVCDAGPKCCPS